MQFIVAQISLKVRLPGSTLRFLAQCFPTIMLFKELLSGVCAQLVSFFFLLWFLSESFFHLPFPILVCVSFSFYTGSFCHSSPH